jgi:hypothetical protein
MSRRGPVSCSGCGQSWELHPVLEVACPQCGARAGAWCVRPSEHQAADLHVDREQLAVDLGFLSKKCPGRRRAA